MPETDKIIEAEQAIQDLAKELNKMHTSANILKAAHEQVDAVLSSSERVIELTESYTGKAGKLISTLSVIDFENRFDGLLGEINQLVGSTNNLEMRLSTLEKEIKKWQILTLIFVILTFLISIILIFV